MFRFGMCCSKFLLLVAAINVLSYGFGESAFSSMPSDAFNGDLLVGELPYSVDSSGIITLKLKKNTGAATVGVELVIAEEHAISFVAIQPTGCLAFRNSECISAAFSYADGCPNFFKWSAKAFYTGEYGRKTSTRGEVAIAIENGRTKNGVLANSNDDEMKDYSVEVCPANFRKNDKSDQAGYLADFTLSGILDCDLSVSFPSEYKILDTSSQKTTEAPSQALALWHIIVISISSVIVTGLLVLVLIYICFKYVCHPKPVLATASTANPSAPVAVTCLPEVKVVKPTVTTQPPLVSGDLKQGPKPVPIPPPPVLPMSAVEKDLPAVPSDKLLAVDDGDDVRLGPNTIEITSLEKKRRRNRRMLRAVDDDEKSAALRSRSLALRNKRRG